MTKKNRNDKSKARDPFLQRAVEHWLDNMNELGYQPLFCEWLATTGFVLKYSIRNTNFEKGKDVVAVDPGGTPYGFQLKGGNISLARWRSEVKPEIDALIDTAIQHPDIDPDKPHVSYLVTNGEIDDSVREEIVATNQKRWKESPLRVWTRGDLLSGFQGMAEGMLPKDAYTYKMLMDLVFVDGTGHPDLSAVSAFFSSILKKEGDSKRTQRKRDIAACMLYANMAVGSYRKAGNHASVVRVMVMLAALILYMAEKYGLPDKYWLGSFRIVWEDIRFSAALLEGEISEDGFSKAYDGIFANDLIAFRKHSAISIILPLKLAQLLCGDTDWRSLIEPSFFEKLKGAVLMWGEASFVPLIILSLILRHGKDDVAASYHVLRSAVRQIIAHNGRHLEKGELISPYYDVDFAVKKLFGLLEEAHEEDAGKSAYMLKSLILLLVRAGDRQFLEEQWKEISHIHFEEFVIQKPEDYLLLRTESGENRTEIPKSQKSWGELEVEAAKASGGSLPALMKRFPEFVPFLISVFPFRCDTETTGFLDNLLSGSLVEAVAQGDTNTESTL